MNIAYICKNKPNFKETIFYYTQLVLFKKLLTKRKQIVISIYIKLIDELRNIVTATEGIFFFLKFCKVYPRENGDTDKFIDLLIYNHDPVKTYNTMIKYSKLCDKAVFEDVHREGLFEIFKEDATEFKYIHFICSVTCKTTEDIRYVIDFTNKYDYYMQFLIDYFYESLNNRSVLIIKAIESLINEIENRNFELKEELFNAFFSCFHSRDLETTKIQINESIKLMNFFFDLNQFVRNDFMSSIITNAKWKLRKNDVETIIRKITLNYDMNVYHPRFNLVEETMFDCLGIVEIICARRKLVKNGRDSIPNE